MLLLPSRRLLPSLRRRPQTRDIDLRRLHLGLVRLGTPPKRSHDEISPVGRRLLGKVLLALRDKPRADHDRVRPKFVDGRGLLEVQQGEGLVGLGVPACVLSAYKVDIVCA